MRHPDIGPDRPSDAFPLTDRAEVEDSQRWLSWYYGGPVILFPTVAGADPDWLSEAEAFDGADELAAALELERWGDSPFGEGER